MSAEYLDKVIEDDRILYEAMQAERAKKLKAKKYRKTAQAQTDALRNLSGQQKRAAGGKKKTAVPLSLERRKKEEQAMNQMRCHSNGSDQETRRNLDKVRACGCCVGMSYRRKGKNVRMLRFCAASPACIILAL